MIRDNFLSFFIYKWKIKLDKITCIKNKGSSLK